MFFLKLNNLQLFLSTLSKFIGSNNQRKKILVLKQYEDFLLVGVDGFEPPTLCL